MPGRVGRPPKPEVDPKIAKAICEHLEIGMPIHLAAELEGIPRRTVRDWLERYPEFSAMTARAHARCVEICLGRAREGGPGSSQATWLLERRFREDFGPPRAEAAPAEVKVVLEGGLPRAESTAPEVKVVLEGGLPSKP